MKNYNMILTEKQQKYQHYHLEKMINMNILQVKKQFTYSPLGKALENQRKTIEDQGIKQVEALKALKSEENQELESIEGFFC